MTNSLWKKHEIESALQISINCDVCANGISTDSRTLSPGELFVAFKGPKFNGNQFAQDALNNGASLVIIDELFNEELLDSPKVILVKCALSALEKLAIYARKRSRAIIIGITGSVGKTSVKDALFHILQNYGNTLATKQSFNNHHGMPFTLAQLSTTHDYAVIEMGMNHLNEISKYSKIAQPHISLILNVTNTHIGNFNDCSEIAQAKSEIFDGMPQGAQAILNSDEKYLNILKTKAKDKNLSISYFHNNHNYYFNDSGIVISPYFQNQVCSFNVKLPTFASHWATNISGIFAILNCLKLDLKKAVRHLEDFQLGTGRGQIIPVNIPNNKKITIVDESFNASPKSMENAIKDTNIIAQKNNGRFIAILGEMLDLGKFSKQCHYDLRNILLQHNVSKVYCCGENMKYLYETLPHQLHGQYNENLQNIELGLIDDIRDNDVYLVKGSRKQWGTHGIMYYIVKALKNLGKIKD